MVLYFKQLVGIVKRQLILAEITHFYFFFKIKLLIITLFIITKEPEECYINIYLLCSDKLEFALPGYFIQSIEVGK